MQYDGQGKPFTVRYHEINTMLLNELQKQHGTVAEQQAEVRRLRSQLVEQQARIQRLEALLTRQPE
ncbi:MAG TPA: hypothetical protein VII86_15540, partial [Thermoanaerobaculia bacterium]